MASTKQDTGVKLEILLQQTIKQNAKSKLDYIEKTIRDFVRNQHKDKEDSISTIINSQLFTNNAWERHQEELSDKANQLLAEHIKSALEKLDPATKEYIEHLDDLMIQRQRQAAHLFFSPKDKLSLQVGKILFRGSSIAIETVKEEVFNKLSTSEIKAVYGMAHANSQRQPDHLWKTNHKALYFNLMKLNALYPDEKFNDIIEYICRAVKGEISTSKASPTQLAPPTSIGHKIASHER
jgi:hypothetical protein